MRRAGSKWNRSRDKVRFKFPGSWILGAGSFIFGYALVDFIFARWKLPYPSRLFGVAAGLGFVCWTIGVIRMNKNRDIRRRQDSVKKLLVLFLMIAVWGACAPACAQPEGALAAKLDQVLQNQERILKELEGIQSELEIVKVRASQR